MEAGIFVCCDNCSKVSPFSTRRSFRSGRTAGYCLPLVCRLVRSRSFADAQIRDKYWQIIVDGTQIRSSRTKLDEKSLYRIHNKGTDRVYTEYYYYIWKQKLSSTRTL